MIELYEVLLNFYVALRDIRTTGLAGMIACALPAITEYLAALDCITGLASEDKHCQCDGSSARQFNRHSVRANIKISVPQPPSLLNALGYLIKAQKAKFWRTLAGTKPAEFSRPSVVDPAFYMIIDFMMVLRKVPGTTKEELPRILASSKNKRALCKLEAKRIIIYADDTDVLVATLATFPALNRSSSNASKRCSVGLLCSTG